MRLFGRSPNFDDAALACHPTRITELFQLVSVGPFHKAVCTAIAREMYISFSLFEKQAI